ncbi:MAG: NAD-dependent epimerase/dehydratase family protein [Acidimicrobiia bacterium]|nr:NAD-dependent epimerase/dehydratase family protein [Acidimicrobiia bacterium]
MRAVVTGAAGFLGRHVARQLVDSGWNVAGFDLSTIDESRVEQIGGDLTDQASVGDALAGSDVVFHIGAVGDVYLAGDQPELAATVNVVGTANVAQAAVHVGARVVYASTWEVYGEPISEPVDEEHPTNPDHPYSITKLAGESLLLAACRLQGLDAIALRLGTAYGSGMRDNSVFSIFRNRAMRGEPITIQGDGSQTRQFTHASDIARAFELAARSQVTGTAFNIVSPETTSIRELAERVVTRYPTELVFGPPRPGDVPPAKVSSKKAEAELDWTARVSFAEGMERFLDSDG